MSQLDFSFLSDAMPNTTAAQQHSLAGAPGGATSGSVAAHKPRQGDAPPLVVELRAAPSPAASGAPHDSWTLWDSNRPTPGTGTAEGGVGGRPGSATSSGAAGGASSSFARAFAHIKDRPGFQQLSAHQPQQAPPALRTQQQQQQQLAANSEKVRMVQVSRRQTNNPVVKHIRNVPWQFADIAADYQMGSQTCCLFLSLRYHQLKPHYIYARMEPLQRDYRLRILLCYVDSEDCTKTLVDLHKLTLINGWTFILVWSSEEAARYLETYLTYENKQADNIQARVEGDYLSRLTDVLTTIRSVNRTDVATMSTSLGSLASMMQAAPEQIALCPGVGDKKVQRIVDAFHQPFLAGKKRPRSEP